MNKVVPIHPATDPAPVETPPHIAVAPGLPALGHTVVREPGETDERYRSRCELLAVLLDFAAKQD